MECLIEFTSPARSGKLVVYLQTFIYNRKEGKANIFVYYCLQEDYKLSQVGEATEA
jgi:hypothetical protein